MTQPRRVSDIVRDMVPFMRNRMSGAEHDLAVHLRGNEALFNALSTVLRERLEGRARLSEPSDPVACKSMVARDRELQWLLGRLDYLYRSPVATPTDDGGEQPA
jgi:hypothetical protein